jgi:hypothetical protein
VINALVFISWCAALWRLRGGAFQALTGIDLGTQVTRIICAFGIATPLVWLHHDWWLMLLAPALWLGLVSAGWGPFQAMDAGKFTDKASAVGWLLDRVGLRVGVSPWRCYIGMAMAGMVCMAPSGMVIGLEPTSLSEAWDMQRDLLSAVASLDIRLLVHLPGWPLRPGYLERGAFVALGGTGFSPLYLAAYRLGLPYRKGSFVDWPTAWAELFVGALVGALLVVALIGA